MVQQSLIAYIQQLLKQGYDPGTVKTTLLNAGYSPVDVDAAMRAAGAPTHKINTKMLLILFLVILALAIGVLLVLKLLQPPPAVLSFQVNLFSTEVAPGQDVVVNAEISNPGGRGTSGLIDYVIDGPSGRIVASTESFTVRDRVSVPSTLSLPDSVVVGSYSLHATLSYADTSTSEVAYFEVVEVAERSALPVEALEERSEVKARELQQTCPGGCDDLNFCTSDSCIQGNCVYTSIVPCCGNRQCESGESVSSCPVDCGEIVGPEQTKATAIETAASDVSQAVEICDSLVQRVYIDGCLEDISDVSKSKDPCGLIIDDDVRDSCYIPFSYEDDFSVCPEITNPYMRNSCESLAKISEISKQQ